MFEYRGGKDLYTGRGKVATGNRTANVDHIIECQLGAFAWGAAVSHHPRLRMLRSDTSLVKVGVGQDNV